MFHISHWPLYRNTCIPDHLFNYLPISHSSGSAMPTVMQMQVKCSVNARIKRSVNACIKRSVNARIKHQNGKKNVISVTLTVAWLLVTDWLV